MRRPAFAARSGHEGKSHLSFRVMSMFVIEPHFRLQEWVAEEKGYFRHEGLEYEFRELVRSTDGAHHKTTGKAGTFQSIEKGREVERELRLPLDGRRGGLERAYEALCGRLFGGPRRDLCPVRTRRSGRRPILQACQSRSATSPAATTPPSRRLNNTCLATGSNCRSRKGCCSPPGAVSRRVNRPPPLCSAALIISPNNSASARSSTIPS